MSKPSKHFPEDNTWWTDLKSKVNKVQPGKKRHKFFRGGILYDMGDWWVWETNKGECSVVSWHGQQKAEAQGFLKRHSIAPTD